MLESPGPPSAAMYRDASSGSGMSVDASSVGADVFNDSSPQRDRHGQVHDGHSHDHHHHHHHDASPVGPISSAYEKDGTHVEPSSSSLPYPLSVIADLPPLPPKLRSLFVYSTCHFALGSSLWLAGQWSDSLSVTGLGYLVVFDSFGVLNDVLSDWISSARASSERERGGPMTGTRYSKAYSTHRVSTLLNFVQTIYLLFAAVYVCKESIEHALLEGGDEGAPATPAPAHVQEASGGGSAVLGAAGSGGHHHHDDGRGVELPVVLLVLATIACLFSNLVLGNHAKLVAGE